MSQFNSRSISGVSALLLATWTFSAAAEQPVAQTTPTTTTTTTTEPATIRTTPVVSDPMVGFESEKSTLPNAPLLLTGTLVLGATYGASAIAAGVSDRESNDKLYYPVVGPWMAWNDRDCTAEPCDNKTLDTTLLIGSGVLQGVGALGMLMSLVIPQSTTENWYLVGNSDFAVAPVGGAREVGAVAVGRF